MQALTAPYVYLAMISQPTVLNVSMVMIPQVAVFNVSLVEMKMPTVPPVYLAMIPQPTVCRPSLHVSLNVYKRPPFNNLNPIFDSDIPTTNIISVAPSTINLPLVSGAVGGAAVLLILLLVVLCVVIVIMTLQLRRQRRKFTVAGELV